MENIGTDTIADWWRVHHHTAIAEAFACTGINVTNTAVNIQLNSRVGPANAHIASTGNPHHFLVVVVKNLRTVGTVPKDGGKRSAGGGWVGGAATAKAKIFTAGISKEGYLGSSIRTSVGVFYPNSHLFRLVANNIK